MINNLTILVNYTRVNSCIHISKSELEKVTAATFACGVFYGCQFLIPAATVIKVTIVCVASTLIAEKTIRKSDHSTSWFNTEKIGRAALIREAALFFIAQTVFGIAMTKLGVAPIQHISNLILQRNIRAIAIVLIAPLSEEILFRGFLKERIEDLVHLVSNFQNNTAHKISNIIQAALFGLVHINTMQTAFANSYLFFATALLGTLVGDIKEEGKGSLVRSIFLHECINASVIYRMLVFGH